MSVCFVLVCSVCSRKKLNRRLETSGREQVEATKKVRRKFSVISTESSRISQEDGESARQRGEQRVARLRVHGARGRRHRAQVEAQGRTDTMSFITLIIVYKGCLIR